MPVTSSIDSSSSFSSASVVELVVLGSTAQPSSPVDGMAVERDRFSALKCSPRVADMLMMLRKKRTNVVYLRIWDQFSLFAYTHVFYSSFFRSGCPFLSSVRSEFRPESSDPEEPGLCYLSFFWFPVETLYELAIQFFKAVRKLKPSRKLLFPKCDLFVVLDFLSPPYLDLVNNPSLWLLTLKASFLTAIMSASRVSKLAALSCKEQFTTFY